MSNFHKSKQLNLVDIFNDASRYIEDIHTSEYVKRDDFVLLILPAGVVMFLVTIPAVSTFHIWLLLLGAALVFSISILEIYKSSQNCNHGLPITQGS